MGDEQYWRDPPTPEDLPLWQRFDAAFTDDEKCSLWNYIGRWMDYNSQPVSIIHEDGTEEDLELNTDEIQRFLETKNGGKGDE